jgi:hypothetical protein
LKELTKNDTSLNDNDVSNNSEENIDNNDIKEWQIVFYDLLAHINTIIERYSSISDNKDDHEMLAGLYYNISETFSDSPILRYTWIESLESLHVKSNNYLEAGM